MNYIEPAAAREMDGLRLALTAHGPVPYSMSARAILDHHGVPYVPVLQVGGGGNEDLVAWTGHRNAPVAVYNDEAPRVGWLEILNLAERLGSGPSLVPSDRDDRMLMVGLSNELIGENGFIWNLRLVMLGLGGPERVARARLRNPMFDQYGYSEEAAAGAVDRARPVVDRLTAQLLAQRRRRPPVHRRRRPECRGHLLGLLLAGRADVSGSGVPDARRFAGHVRSGGNQAR